MDLIESSNLKKKDYRRKETINIQGNRQYLSSLKSHPLWVTLYIFYYGYLILYSVVTLSDPPYNDDNASFTTVPLKPVSDQ